MHYDLNTFGMWFGAGLLMVVGGLNQSGWKHRFLVIGMIGVGGVFIAAALLWPVLQKAWPALAAFMSSAATPTTWVVLLLLAAAYLLLGPQFRAEVQHQGSTQGVPRPADRSELVAQGNWMKGEVAGVQTHIGQVQTELAGINETIGDIERQIAVNWPNSKTVAEAFSNLAQAMRSKADGVEGEVQKLRGAVLDAHRDLKKSLAISEAICALAIFDRVVLRAPVIPPVLNEADEEEVRNSITLYEAELLRLGRRDTFANIMRNAEKNTDEQLEKSHPQGFTAAFRKRQIAGEQARLLLKYFAEQKGAAEEFLRDNAPIVSAIAQKRFAASSDLET
ncbi:MAG TPA: hypothetical protein VGM17_16690 [Rhizomicrobium sp.]|jgi:hypothetical protein